jgi:glycerate kinase
MKIVIAPDSYKESLSALEVATSIRTGFQHVYPSAEYCLLPLADGGEGTVDVLLHGLNGVKKTSEVTGPNGSLTVAEWAVFDDGKTALIEIAQASGLDKIAVSQRNPMQATTFGTGELILEALEAGVSKIILGLGGSATNDGGAGIVQALGGKLLNQQGHLIDFGGGNLDDLYKIDLSGIHPRCQEVTFIVACDVSNCLCGEEGASFVFGPQKGASIDEVKHLDRSLAHFSQLSEQATGRNYEAAAGYGAAGGTPLGLSLLFNIKIIPGIEMVLETLKADEILQGCDLLITGEGQIDNQTINGKTPYGIAKLAKKHDIAVIGISGSLGKEVDKLYGKLDSMFATIRSPQPLNQVLTEAEANLIKVARNVAATIKIGQQL